MKNMKKFVTQLQGTERLSENTITNYVQDITYFVNWLKNKSNKVFEKADAQDIKDFMAHLTTECTGRGGKKGLAPTSVNRKLSSIQKGYEFLIEIGEMKDNPARAVKRQKIDKDKKPNFLIEEEVNVLFDAVQNDNRNGVKKEAKVRDYTILRLLVATGVRVAELCDIELKNISFRKKTLTVIGKGSKERIIPISDGMIEIIKSYMDIRHAFKPQTEKLFVTKQGNGIDRRQVNRMIKSYCNVAGLDADLIHAHTFRHTCATITYNHNGGNLLGIQQLLGHSDIGTTQIYTHLAGDALRRSAMANPFA